MFFLCVCSFFSEKIFKNCTTTKLKNIGVVNLSFDMFSPYIEYLKKKIKSSIIDFEVGTYYAVKALNPSAGALVIDFIVHIFIYLACYHIFWMV